MLDFVSPCEALCVYFGGSVFLFSVLVWFLPHCFKLGVLTMIVADIALAAGIAFPRRLTELLNEQGISEAMLPPIEDALIWGAGSGIGFFILCFALYYLVVLRKLKHQSRGSGVTYDKNSPQAQYQSPKSHTADAGSAKAFFKASKGNADLPLNHDNADDSVTEVSRISVTVGDDEESAPKKFLKQKQRRRGRRNLRLQDSNNLENDSLSSLEGNPLYAGVKDDAAQEVRLSPTNAVEPELNGLHKNPLDGVVADSELGHGSAVLVDQALSGVKIGSGTDSVLLSPARELQESILDDAAQKAAAAEAKSTGQKAQIDHTQSSAVSEHAVHNAGNPTLRSVEPERLERLSELTPEADETGSMVSDLHPNTEQILAHVHGTNYNLPERTSDLGSIPFDTSHGESIDVEVMPGSKVGDVLSAIEDGRMPEGFAQAKPQVDIAKESSFSFADMLDSAQKYQKHGLGDDDDILVDVTDDIAHNEQLSHQDLGLDKLSEGTVPPADAMSHPQLQTHENEQKDVGDLGEDALEEQPIFVKRTPHHLTVDEALHSLEQAELEQLGLDQEKLEHSDLVPTGKEQTEFDKAESNNIGQYQTAGELLHSLEQQEEADKPDMLEDSSSLESKHSSSLFDKSITSKQDQNTVANAKLGTDSDELDDKSPIVTLDPDFDNPTASKSSSSSALSAERSDDASTIAHGTAVHTVVPVTLEEALEDSVHKAPDAIASSQNNADVESKYAEEFDVLGIVPELVESTQIVRPQTLEMPRELTKLMQEPALEAQDEVSKGAKVDKAAVENLDKSDKQALENSGKPALKTADKLAIENAEEAETHEPAYNPDVQNLENHNKDDVDAARQAVHGSYQFAMPVGGYGNYGQAQYIAHLDAQELSHLFTHPASSKVAVSDNKAQPPVQDVKTHAQAEQPSGNKLNSVSAAVDSEVKQPSRSQQLDVNTESKQETIVFPAESKESAPTDTTVANEQANNKLETLQAPTAPAPQALQSNDIALDIIPTIPASPLPQDLSDDITPSIPVAQSQDEALVVADTHTPAVDSHVVPSVSAETAVLPHTPTAAKVTPAPYLASSSQGTLSKVASDLAQGAIQNKQATTHTVKTPEVQHAEQSKVDLKQHSAVSSRQDKQQDTQQAKLHDKQPEKHQIEEASVQPSLSQSSKHSVQQAHQSPKVNPVAVKKQEALSEQLKSPLTVSASTVPAQTSVHKSAAEPQLAQAQTQPIVQPEQSKVNTPATNLADTVKTEKTPANNLADSVKAAKTAGAKTIDENRTHLAPKRAAMRRLGRGIASLSQRAVEYGSNYQPTHAHVVNGKELSQSQNAQSLAVTNQSAVNQERVNTTGSKAATALAPVLSHTPLSPVNSPAPHAQVVNQAATQPLAQSAAYTSAQALGQVSAQPSATDGTAKVRSSLKAGFGKGLGKPANSLAARNVSALLNANRAQKAHSSYAQPTAGETQAAAVRVQSPESIKSAESAKLAERVKTVGTVKPTESVKSTDSIKPATKVTPQSVNSQQSNLAAESGQSILPSLASSASSAVSATSAAVKHPIGNTPAVSFAHGEVKELAQGGALGAKDSLVEKQTGLQTKNNKANNLVEGQHKSLHPTSEHPSTDTKTQTDKSAPKLNKSLKRSQPVKKTLGLQQSKATQSNQSSSTSQSELKPQNSASIDDAKLKQPQSLASGALHSTRTLKSHRQLSSAESVGAETVAPAQLADNKIKPIVTENTGEPKQVEQRLVEAEQKLLEPVHKLAETNHKLVTPKSVEAPVSKQPSVKPKTVEQGNVAPSSNVQTTVSKATDSKIADSLSSEVKALQNNDALQAHTAAKNLKSDAGNTSADTTVNTATNISTNADVDTHAAQLAPATKTSVESIAKSTKSAVKQAESTVKAEKALTADGVKLETKSVEPTTKNVVSTVKKASLSAKNVDSSVKKVNSAAKKVEQAAVNTSTEVDTVNPADKDTTAIQAKKVESQIVENTASLQAPTASLAHRPVAQDKTTLRSAKASNTPEKLKSEQALEENQSLQQENSTAKLSQTEQTTKLAQAERATNLSQATKASQNTQSKHSSDGQGKSLARGPRVKPAAQPHKEDKSLSKTTTPQGYTTAAKNRQTLAMPSKEPENTLASRKHSLAKNKSVLGKSKTTAKSEQSTPTEVSSQDHP